ncbi:putative aldolase class 2 protein CC_1201 [Ptychodera flava]|uniref:putative aldolase class 2 protein CC_1201 n=1 Tax=Ptychodera flava TaxID=63121 RepID=UPI00396A1749
MYRIALSGVRSVTCRVSASKTNTSSIPIRWCSAVVGQIRRQSTASTARTLEPGEAESLNYQARVDLAAAYRGLANYGLHEGICNHLTLSAPGRDGTSRVMLLIPYGLHWREVTASKLIGVDIKTGKIIEGEGKPETSASEIHRAVHNARPDITASLHVHPPNATALGTLKDPQLLMLHQNSCRFYKDIAYDLQYDGYATSGEEGPRLAKVLADKKVIVMGNHGILIVSKSIAQAFDDVYYFERSAEVQVLAMSTGREIQLIPETLVSKIKEEADTTLGPYGEAHFESIKQLLLREEPDFRS